MDARIETWVGVDVSKETLDVCVLRPTGKPQSRQFANTPAGQAKLLRWVQSLAQPQGVRAFVLEATGAYSHALATYLAEQGERVSVANPARIKYFGMGEGVLNKTDKADARLIALYGQKKMPQPWRMSQPHVQRLVALVRRLQALQDHLTQERNRLGEPSLDPVVARSIRSVIRALEQEMSRLEEQVRQHIDQHPDLRADRELLLSIQGIGEKLAHWILAELPDVHQFATGKSAAAFAGLSPKQYTSGTSVRRRTRLSKAGNPRLRGALYMPTMAAIRFNPLVRALYLRLLERGKSRMCAVGAAMRKLLMLAYGVLKSRRPFDPNFTPSFTAAAS